jgi:anti-anti-sigma factor
VTFLGSAGLAMLVKLRSRLGRRLALVRVPPTVRHAFEVTGLDQLFDLR